MPQTGHLSVAEGFTGPAAPADVKTIVTRKTSTHPRSFVFGFAMVFMKTEGMNHKIAVENNKRQMAYRDKEPLMAKTGR